MSAFVAVALSVVPAIGAIGAAATLMAILLMVVARLVGKVKLSFIRCFLVLVGPMSVVYIGLRAVESIFVLLAAALLLWLLVSWGCKDSRGQQLGPVVGGFIVAPTLLIPALTLPPIAYLLSLALSR